MAKKLESLSFEQAISELEQIVDNLEQGDVALDDALKQFERGIKLVRQSQTKLDQAQQKVSILLDDDSQLQTFEPDSE
ncbi:exodeoxyribonuclease VII small subunit [Shewanella sp. WXL01]|uniref:Exodeoxyribonuclease 7 small subunit n=1 Tax=Shewanella maritima TaxID=2520507 RepID=A0A411PE32_9GAMM|nr:exodeoxyribonuclease VII small subunit [Shewanella maritima]NKF50130.1 exodeoxyribonuclease VII small subunit [Shewanella sp. WXL01]QBF81819.1 exodeoxyribonuclease VII small subunit [Shewanella maritima]